MTTTTDPTPLLKRIKSLSNQLKHANEQLRQEKRTTTMQNNTIKRMEKEYNQKFHVTMSC